MPSRDEILTVYQAGPKAIVALVEALVSAHQLETVQLTARIEQLENRLGKDSHNSHKPPSSDGPGKRPRTRNLRKRSGKKSGGQSGHPGVTRCLVDDPDQIVAHVPTVCAACGLSLETAPAVAQQQRQVIEIPQPRLEVTEHQAVQKACPVCQTISTGGFPPEVTQPVQHLPRTQVQGYGPRTKAAAVYLQTYQPLPYERTVQALGDLFGVYPSEGTLATAQALAYTRLAPVEQAIQQALRQTDAAHVDPHLTVGQV